MKKEVPIVATTMAVVAAAVVLAASVLFFIIGRQAVVPMSVRLPFDSWEDARILPPLPTGEYQVIVDYAHEDGGRLGEPLRIRLTDETAGRIVPIEGDPIFWQDLAVVGDCHLLEGHQYRIEVESEQVKELGLHHHRLRIGRSPDEPTERTSGEPNSAKRASAPKKWDPVELEKARAMRRAWEAAGRP